MNRLIVRRAVAVTLITVGASFAQPAPQPAELPGVPTPVFNDPSLPADAKDVQITADIEVAIERRSPSHYTVRSAQTANTGGQYFLIHLGGVAGRTVEIDFEGAPFSKWGNAVPLYSYADDLDALESFDANADIAEADTKERPAVGETLPALPDTSKQGWHYVSVADHTGERIAVRQKFEKDQAYVAFKVPFTPGYGQAYLDLLHDEPAVKIEDVGKSPQGRPLQIATVSKERAAGGPTRPCVLLYAREHPDDQDGSWIAQGALAALVSARPEIVALRDQCDFIVIPMLDPDGAASAAHGNIITSFYAEGQTAEAKAYMAWFNRWIETGHRVDVAISLHSSVPGSNFHLACPLMEPDPARLAACEALHKQIRDPLLEQGYAVRNSPWQKGKSVPVLSGWLQEKYGTLVLPYVSASLQAKSQLTLDGLRTIGGTIVKGSGTFLISVDGKALSGQIDTYRANAAGPTTAPAQ